MKKLTSLLIALAMLLSFASFAAEEEPYVITAMLPDFYTDTEFVKDGNPVLEAITAATGVKLEITWVANSVYPDQTSLTLADPDNMPMIMVLQGVDVDNARAGAFWDLTDYIDDFDNLAAGAAAVYNNISVDGRIYGIYRARNVVRNGPYYRSDIAKAVGYENEPATLEEFTKLCYDMLAYIKANYGDNAYLLNCCEYIAGTIEIITVMHGAPYLYGVDEEGVLYPSFEAPEYLEGLTWLRELYAAGGIDPEFMTIASGNWNDAERNNTAFMRFDCLDNGYRQQEWFETNQGVTEQIFAILAAVPNANGDLCVKPTSGYNGQVVITKAVKTEEDFLKCLGFLDWCNSAEGQTLVNWGVEGETYWIWDDGYRYTTPVDGTDMTSYVTAVQHSLNQIGMNVNGDLTPPAATTPLRSEFAAMQGDPYLLANLVADPTVPLQASNEAYTKYNATLATKLEDAAVQYIAGIIDEDALFEVWDAWYVEGGQEIVDGFNALYNK